MARKYSVHVTFELETQMEAEFYSSAFEVESDQVKEFEESNYFPTQEVSVDGGDCTYVIEADSEDEAEAIVAEQFNDGNEIEDQNGFTWTYDRVEIEVEAMEVTVESLSEAREVIAAFMDEWDEDGTDAERHPQFQAAITFMLDHTTTQSVTITQLQNQLSELRTLIADLQAQVTTLSERIKAMGGQVFETPFGPSEEPTIA
jgi:uncharacterized coiled-coil protein SlyX